MLKIKLVILTILREREKKGERIFYKKTGIKRDVIVGDIKYIDEVKFKAFRDSIHCNQQIILRYEWKRIKGEIKKVET